MALDWDSTSLFFPKPMPIPLSRNPYSPTLHGYHIQEHYRITLKWWYRWRCCNHAFQQHTSTTAGRALHFATISYVTLLHRQLYKVVGHSGQSVWSVHSSVLRQCPSRSLSPGGRGRDHLAPICQPVASSVITQICSGVSHHSWNMTTWYWSRTCIKWTW